MIATILISASLLASTLSMPTSKAARVHAAPDPAAPVSAAPVSAAPDPAAPAHAAPSHAAPTHAAPALRPSVTCNRSPLGGFTCHGTNHDYQVTFCSNVNPERDAVAIVWKPGKTVEVKEYNIHTPDLTQLRDPNDFPPPDPEAPAPYSDVRSGRGAFELTTTWLAKSPNGVVYTPLGTEVVGGRPVEDTFKGHVSAELNSTEQLDEDVDCDREASSVKQTPVH